MIAELQQNQTRQDNRTRWMLHLVQFQSEVLAKAESWMRAARNIGSAYKTAAEKHKSVLDDQKSSDALSTQIMFSILTVASVGTLSWASSLLQSKYSPHSALIEAVEDFAQAGAGEAMSAIGPVYMAPNLKPVNQDPQVYQNDLENAVSAVKQEAFSAFGRIQNEASKASLESWDKFDETKQQQEHKTWQGNAKNLAGEEDLPSVAAMAKELERGIWARYVLESHSHRDFGLFRTAESYDFVGYHVIKALERLGVTQPLGILTQLHGQDIPEGMMDPAIIGANEEMYVDRLVKWATTYQVKDMVSYAQYLRDRHKASPPPKKPSPAVPTPPPPPPMYRPPARRYQPPYSPNVPEVFRDTPIGDA